MIRRPFDTQPEPRLEILGFQFNPVPPSIVYVGVPEDPDKVIHIKDWHPHPEA